MASNSSGPASPINAAEAEQLAAQFRPVWDVDDGHADMPPAPQAAAPTPPVPAPAGLPKATMRWSPGAGPDGLPAPVTAPTPAPVPAPEPAPVVATPLAPVAAPPAPVATVPLPPPAPGPLPAPAPRKQAQLRAEAPAPEVRELAGGDEKVSSDGSVAMALISGPVLPPKAAEVSISKEPSIVVQDVAALARSLAAEEEAAPPPGSQKKAEEQAARRRQTVRLDELRNDPAVAAMQARYESNKKTAEAPEPPRAPASAPRPAARSQQAELPEASDAIPVNSNRKVVLGVVGVAAVIALVGIAKVTLSGKEEAPTATTSTATADTATRTDKPKVEPEKTAAPAATTAAAAATTATPAATTTAKATAAATTAEPPKVATKEPPAAKTAAPTTAAPATKDPPSTTTKKTGKTGTGIVREVPFLTRPRVSRLPVRCGRPCWAAVLFLAVSCLPALPGHEQRRAVAAALNTIGPPP